MRSRKKGRKWAHGPEDPHKPAERQDLGWIGRSTLSYTMTVEWCGAESLDDLGTIRNTKCL